MFAETDPHALDQLHAHLRAEQRVHLALLGGIAGALIGAAVWCMITVVSGYQISWMAIGVGALTGAGVRTFGRGVDAHFGWIGGALAVSGCLLGNLMSVCQVVAAQEQGVTFTGLLGQLDLAMVLGLVQATAAPIDLLFYALAIGMAYRISFRRVAIVDR